MSLQSCSFNLHTLTSIVVSSANLTKWLSILFSISRSLIYKKYINIYLYINIYKKVRSAYTTFKIESGLIYHYGNLRLTSPDYQTCTRSGEHLRLVCLTYTDTTLTHATSGNFLLHVANTHSTSLPVLNQ